MYGEIAAPLVDQFIESLAEGKIYELSRFIVSKMKNWYKPVDCDLMIRFGRYTIVKEIDNDVVDYPLCTYALTPLDELPSPTDNPTSFIGYAPYLFEESGFATPMGSYPHIDNTPIQAV